MGLDLEDVLSGVGAGLSKYGSIKEDRRKEELAQRLEQEREERAEQRKQAAEQREERRNAARVAKTRTVEKDGVLYEQNINNLGDVLNEQLADKLTIEQVSANRRKQELELTNEGLQGDVRRMQLREAELELGYLPKKYSLEQRVAEANINQSNASAEASLATARDRDRPDPKERVDTSLGAMSNQLVGEFDELKEQYADVLEPNDFLEAAQEALLAAGRNKRKGITGNGLDARLIYRLTLKKMAERRKK